MRLEAAVGDYGDSVTPLDDDLRFLEALIRVAVVIAIPLGIVAVGGAIYLISKARKK